MSVLTKPIGTTSWLPLVMRIILGAAFFAHGAQKVLGWYGGGGLQATVAQFAQGPGIPYVLGYVAAYTEFIGGIFLILGFATRIASIGIFIEMIVAIWLVHFPKGYFLNSPFGGMGFEYNLALVGLAFAITLTGPGLISLDYQLFEAAHHHRHERPLGDVHFVRR